jgi:hypothetical protein
VIRKSGDLNNAGFSISSRQRDRKKCLNGANLYKEAIWYEEGIIYIFYDFVVGCFERRVFDGG